MRRYLLALALLVLPVVPAAAQDFNSGVKAYERGDYAQALREWRPLAEQGGASAQFNVGQMYFLGRGVPQDYAQALKWHTLAAEQGNASAQSVLGSMYAAGRGVRQDFVQAYMWHALAAEGGDHGRFLRDERVARDEAARHMTPEQIAEAQKRVRDRMAKR
jgi:uncharacterized protein